MMLQKSGLQKTLIFCTRFIELSALNTNKKWKTSDFYGSSSMMPHCQKSTKFKYKLLCKNSMEKVETSVITVTVIYPHLAAAFV